MMAHADSLGEIEHMLRDSLGKALERHYTFEKRQMHLRGERGYSLEAWNAYMELGLPRLGVDEAAGGVGGGLKGLAIVCELLGGALALEPLLPTVAFGSRLIGTVGTPEQKARLLPSILSGEQIVALAHGERTSRYGSAGVMATAEPDGEGFRLSGEKKIVAGGDAADLLVVSARVRGDGAQVRLFLVGAGSAGVQRRSYRTFDGCGAADIAFNDVSLSEGARLGCPGDAGDDSLERALDEAAVLQCADAVGVMKRANALTLEHVRTRRQFGVPIGSFQAIQHRLVDMAIAADMADAMTVAAVAAIDAPPAERARMVSAAKVRVGESARLISQETVQLHGGMGLAEEHPAAHCFARLGLFERRWGDADHHLDRFSRLMAPERQLNLYQET